MAIQTLYPSLDGYITIDITPGAGVSWATIVAGVADWFVDQSSATAIVLNIWADIVSDRWLRLSRSIFIFDTSSLGSGSVITGATLSVYGTSKTDDLGCTPNLDVYTASPLNNTFLVTSDYLRTGSISQTGGNPISYSSFSTTGYNDFVLNSTGISNINKTGLSKFAIRNANFDVANIEPSWSNGNRSSISINYSESGQSTSPKLTITYNPFNSLLISGD